MGMKPRIEPLQQELPGLVSQSHVVDEFASLPDNLVNQSKKEGMPLRLKGTAKPGGAQ